MIENQSSIEETPQDITEQIKTFEDACNVLGKGHPFVRLYTEYITYVKERNKENEDVPSYLKLRIIAYALNECWYPTYAADEQRYYLEFRMHTKEEFDKIPDEEKEKLMIFEPLENYPELRELTLVCQPYLGRNDFSRPISFICFKSYELALYCVEQFPELWVDCLFHEINYLKDDKSRRT